MNRLTLRACTLIVGAVLAACQPDFSDPAETLNPANEWEGEDNVSFTEDELNRCSNGETVRGIDVSYWQGDINWNAVRNDNVRFAFIRHSYGLWEDPKFDRNWRQAKEAGVLRGVYQYFRASQDPERQARRLVERLGNLGPGELPVVLDLEEFDGTSAGHTLRGALIWLQTVAKGTGKTPIVYTNLSTYQALGSPRALSSFPLWLASWGTTCPTMPQGWYSWKLHQYSARGSVNGISGDVDMNRFNGTIEHLKNFAGDGQDCLSPGLHCGGHGAMGNVNTLYRCEGGTKEMVRGCASGCAVVAGEDDRCENTDICPLGNGNYCGGDYIGGNRQTLYECRNGNLSEIRQCADRCVWEGIGKDDHCS